MNKTIAITEETTVDAPTTDVWAIVADYRRDPEWRAGVRTMVPDPLGIVTAGTTTLEEIRIAGKTYRNAGEVTSVDDGRRFEWRTTSGAVAHGARWVVAVGDHRCRVGLELHVTPTGVNRLLAPVLARTLRRNLSGDLQRLRQRVEHAMAAT